MPPEANDAAYLWDMLEAAKGVARSVESLILE